MVKEFQGKNYWALILGGSSGLGLATAKKLASSGMDLLIVHRDRRAEMTRIETDFDLLRKNYHVQIKSFNIDAINEEKRKATIDEMQQLLNDNGKIRVLVHSIAKGNLKPMTGQEPNLKNIDFQLTLQSMAISLYDWVKAVFDAKIFSDDARIISFTSEGNTKAWKNYAAVSAAKVALEAITRSIALEFAPYGIRANCIQAGTTDTASFRMIPGSDKLKKHAEERNPFQRMTLPEDVANAVYLLCKDEAAWINGCIIPVNGGEHLT